MPIGLTFSKTSTPHPIRHFLKFNTYPHLIIDDFKILGIHDQPYPGKITR
jgi:hypothetical protein